LQFSGSDTSRKVGQVSVGFATAGGTTLFICNTELARKDSLRIARDDTVSLRIPELPLSAGLYRLGLYLERAGVIEDWIKDDLEIEVGDGDFFGSGRNTHVGSQGQVVLVRHSWDIVRSDRLREDAVAHDRSVLAGDNSEKSMSISRSGALGD
jgi:hypothetical protein